MRIFFWAIGAVALLYSITLVGALLLPFPAGALVASLFGFVSLLVFLVLLVFGAPLPMLYLMYRFRPGSPRWLSWGLSVASGAVVIFLYMERYFPAHEFDMQEQGRFFSNQQWFEIVRTFSYELLALPIMFCGIFTFHKDIGSQMLARRS